MVLEAIRYERGKLKLLEQRKLPYETTWVDIKTCEDGWQAIRDMTVRGAPAIAISGALSLAVELVNGQRFKSASEAADVIEKKLRYLETSRPTAVNLFIAVKQLSSLVKSVAKREGATGDDVVQAVVMASEEMLAEDGRSNRIMGNFGADALMRAAKARGRVRAGKIRVLTHCNTGSLATAAFGTALGVVRTLHERGELEQVYCTETRPYNQGARLTAFEIATDNMPGTLICDSAVSALMQSNKVDAVVVGADRIAANGDTANKIGTFNIAVAAAYHNIPFFIAAPTTTIDPELKNGSLIPIEQRSEEEITHFRGTRIAADLPVWNPSFDVTPASLIEGIITERGLAPRISPHSAFQLPAWVKGADNREMSNISAEESTELLPADTGNFVELTTDMAIEYVISRPHLSIHVGDISSRDSWEVREVGDGNLNFVFIVQGPSGAVCIKQAPPFVRVIGSDWPLTQDRSMIEADALVEECRYCPGHVPAVLHFDEEEHILVMEYISPPHITLRNGLIESQIYPKLADHLVTLLSRILFKTSYLSMNATAFRQMCAKFSNKDMCALTEQVIFSDPYFNAKNNRHTSPDLDEDVLMIQNDEDLKAEATKMKAIFIERQQALIHGDLHTGSFMVTEDSTYAIDPEFAFVGPIGFDVGKIIANFLLAYLAADGLTHTDGIDRTMQKSWLLDTVERVWNGFEESFISLWNEDAAAEEGLYTSHLLSLDGQGAKAIQRDFFSSLWSDMLGFAGCVLIRRIVGVAHVADMETIKDSEQRANCERKALVLGVKLLKERQTAFPDIKSVTNEASSL